MQQKGEQSCIVIAPFISTSNVDNAMLVFIVDIWVYPLLEDQLSYRYVPLVTNLMVILPSCLLLNWYM
jgi:hypothetical protein